MIFGIGTDILEIDRIHESLNRNLKLLDKMFSQKELEMLKAKNYRAESVAGNFCAKEAVMKSIGTGLRGFSLKEVQILRDELGAPFLEAEGKLKNRLEELGISEIKVSISHSKNYATATAISIKKEG